VHYNGPTYVPLKSVPNMIPWTRHLDRFSRFFHSSPVCSTQRQTDTDHATYDICIAISPIYALCAIDDA